MNNQEINFTGEIMILTGTPGSGKTTVAKTLSHYSGSAKVHLHTDDFWHYIKNGAIPPYMEEAHKQNTVVMEAIANVAEIYAKGGYFVIVDGIIGEWFLEVFNKINLPIHYIMLKPDLDAAIQRCKQRGGNTLSDDQVITSLHTQFFSSEAFTKHILPTGKLNVTEVIEKLLIVMEQGAMRL